MAKGRIEANDIVADNYLSKAIQSATVYEQHLLQISAHINQILADTSKMAGSGNANSSSGINATTTAYNNANTALNAYNKMQNDVANLQAKLSLLMSGETDDVIKLRKEIQQLTASKKRQAEVTQAEVGAYQQAVNELHKVKRAVLDLLVAEKANTAEAKKLIEEYEKLNKTVRKAEEGVGQYHRNVGNYTSGQRKYNYEMFQMTQIMRELPNFAMSARIGVMALSNNLPQLGDAFRNIATDINTTTGKINGYGFATKTMLKSIFSWQSLMLVGITIAVAYADAIGKWVSGLFKAEKAFKSLNTEAELHKYAVDKSGDSYIKAQSEIDKFTSYVDLAKRGLMDKKAVTDEYNKSLGNTLGTVKDFYEIEGKLIKQGHAYVQMMLYKSAAEEAAKESGKEILELVKEKQVWDEGKGKELQGLKAKYGIMAEAGTPEQATQISEFYKRFVGGKRPSEMQDETHFLTLISQELTLMKKNADRFDEQQKLYRQLMEMSANAAAEGGLNYFGAGGGGATTTTTTTTGGKGKSAKEISDDSYKLIMEQIEFSRKSAQIQNEIRKNEILAINDDGEERKRIEQKNKRNIMEIDLKFLEHKLRMQTLLRGGTDQDRAETQQQIDLLKSELGIGGITEGGKAGKTTSTTVKTTTPANAMKDTAKAMAQLGQALDQFLDAQEKRRQQQIERQIDATKRRQDDLKLLASIGSKDAKDSLAIEEKRQAELERKQDQIARRNAKRQLGIAALNSYSAKVGRGDVNATASTISDIATLMGFISALPGFYEGTENVEKSLGKPSIKGKDGYVIRVDGKERVLNPTQNMKIGNMSNEDLAELAYSHRTKSVKSNAPLYNDEIINKLDSVEQAIKSQPIYDTAWNEQEQAIQRTITAGNFVQKELFKTGGVWRK